MIGCRNGGIQALEEGEDGMTRKGRCLLCERTAGVHGALSGDG